MTDLTLRAWAYLSRVVEPPCAELAALVNGAGPIEAAERVSSPWKMWRVHFVRCGCFHLAQLRIWLILLRIMAELLSSATLEMT